MLEAFLYFAQLAALVMRVKALGFRGVTRTVLVVEDPTQPLDILEVTRRLEGTGAVVLPAIRFVL